MKPLEGKRASITGVARGIDLTRSAEMSLIRNGRAPASNEAEYIVTQTYKLDGGNWMS